MPASEITIAELLQRRRATTPYTSASGTSATPTAWRPHDQGFDESLLMASGLYLPVDDPGRREREAGLRPDRPLPVGGACASRRRSTAASRSPARAGYLTDYYTDEAVKVIEANAIGRSSCTSRTGRRTRRCRPRATTTTRCPTSTITAMRVYAAMIRASTAASGACCRRCERQRSRGEHAGDLHLRQRRRAATSACPTSTSPFRGWKITFFEGGIHVPFFVKWPARHRGRHASRRAPVHALRHLRDRRRGRPARRCPPTARSTASTCVPVRRRRSATGAPHQALFWRTGHYQVGADRTAGSSRSNERPPGSPGSSTCAAIPPSRPTWPRASPSASQPCVARWPRTMPSRWSRPGPRWSRRPSTSTRRWRARRRGDEYIYWPN